MLCFAVATGEEPGLRSVNVAQLTGCNIICSAHSVGCKGLFMTNTEGESSHNPVKRGWWQRKRKASLLSSFLLKEEAIGDTHLPVFSLNGSSL